MNPVRLAWGLWLIGWVSMITVPLVLMGCAEQRYLTKEQDEEFFNDCAHGCIIIPFPSLDQRHERQAPKIAI